MVSHTLILSKIVGTVSLGALAGTLATSSNVSLPLILLTSPKDAGQYLKTLTAKTTAIVKPLSIAAFSSLTLSYLAAGPSGKHPYLLYAAFAIPITYAVGYFKALPAYSSLASLLSQKPAAASDSAPEPASAAPVEQEEEPSTPQEEERSGLDNSIYNNISKSDLESSEDEVIAEADIPKIPKIPKVTKPAAPSHVPAVPAVPSKPAEFSAEVSPLVETLVKYGRIATGVTSTAFLIVTVGIYGDLQ